MTLNEFFISLPDTRRSQGQRYALPDVLWMIFLSISCGYVGYRGTIVSFYTQVNLVFGLQFFQ